MSGDLCCPKCAAELTAFGMTGADIRNMQRQLVGMAELLSPEVRRAMARLEFAATSKHASQFAEDIHIVGAAIARCQP